MEQQQAMLHLLQQIQQAQQVQQLLSQQQQPAPLLLQPSAFHQLQQHQVQPQNPLQFLQQRNLLFQPLPPQSSITEVPVSSPSESCLIPSAFAVPSDCTQSSCSSSDTASISTSSKSKDVIEVDSISAVKAALAAKESSDESIVKTESKSLKRASNVDVTFAISSDSDDDETEEQDDDFQPKKPRKNTGKEIDDAKKKACKGPEKPKSRAGRPKNAKNKGEAKSSLIKKLESLQSPSVSVINADNVPGRSLRSNGRIEPVAGSSSNLHPVEIGFDFTPRKPIDPEILERIEACIVKTTTSWDEVVGLDTAKELLREAAVLPLIRPELFVGPRAASKGVLMYGPPGTGKTMLAKCAASASNCTFISIRASDLMSKWIGDGEKGVAALFDVARQKQPTIIFIDEVDSLLSARRQGEHDAIRRIKTEILSQWDGLTNDTQSRIMVLGATNRPIDLDLAAMRRFARHVYVPLPDIEARKGMYKKFAESRDVKVKLSEVDIVALGLHTSNYSAADITNVLNDACMAPIRELSFEEVERIPLDEIRPVFREDIEKTLLIMKPTCNADAIAELEKWKCRNL